MNEREASALGSGRGPSSGRLLSRARYIGERGGSRPPQDDADRPNASRNISPRDPRGEGSADDCLTEEELAILRLTADGLPLNSVARHVGMSSRTVRRRLRGLCDRLGVTHPIQAVVWAARRGLI
jgi:DNA-binding NarL/FixJ family response regulator